MKNIGLVFSFEFKAILRKKSFLITSLILCLIVVAVIIVPSLLSKNTQTSFSNLSVKDYAITSEDGTNQDELTKSIAGGGFVLETDDLEKFSALSVFETKYTTETDLIIALENDEISYGVVFQSANSYKFLVNGQKNELAEQIINQSLLQYNRENYFSSQGINHELIDDIYGLNINSENIDISEQGPGNFLYSMAYTFIMYMMIILYGSTVSTSVAREKDNRTMEVLIANTKADYLIVGKTLAAGLAGLLQIILLIVVALTTIQISGQNVMELLTELQFNLNITTIIATVFFGIAGYISYLFIYAALGAMVSKIEDINYAVTPITLLFVGAYFITFTGIQAPHNPIFKFASYFPLTSVLAMPVRSSLLNIDSIEIIISAIIMLISIVIFSIIAIRIYRLGSLNYGNRMKFIKTIKMIIKGEGN